LGRFGRSKAKAETAIAFDLPSWILAIGPVRHWLITGARQKPSDLAHGQTRVNNCSVKNLVWPKTTAKRTEPESTEPTVF
jgi:hypothetical protein